jgi:NAD+ synthase
MPAWAEQITLTEWEKGGSGWACKKGENPPIEEGVASAYLACMTGLRDYVEKNGFPGVVLGMSGGIDSALVAALAADALGPSRVHAVMLPYRYTSADSLKDAADCAKALQVRYDVVAIEQPVEGFAHVLAGVFKGSDADITEENIQSRVRSPTNSAAWC